MGIQGGLGKTDMPLRTWLVHTPKYLMSSDAHHACSVYPSYNIDDPLDKPAVLLCSYSVRVTALR